jgi:hypothetical protein
VQYVYETYLSVDCFVSYLLGMLKSEIFYNNLNKYLIDKMKSVDLCQVAVRVVLLETS